MFELALTVDRRQRASQIKRILCKSSLDLKPFRKLFVVGKRYANVGIESPPDETIERNHKGLT